MKLFKPTDPQALDEQVLDQALLWMVTLQSGVSNAAEQQACQHWRAADPQHERAWQRLTGLNNDLRSSTQALSAPGARHLLQARGRLSRRSVLKGFAGLGIATAVGLGVRERVLLPELFSDYHTATGERRQVLLAEGTRLQLDTRTAVDLHNLDNHAQLALNLGRLLITSGSRDTPAIRTRDGWVQAQASSRLVVSQGLPGEAGTLVQVFAGSAAVQSLHGGSASVEAGRQCRFERQRVQPPGELAASAEAWTQGLLIAERMPLAQVIAHLDRYRPGVLRCDAAVAQLQVSGAFSLDQPDASLELLSKVLPIRVQRVLGYWATVSPLA